MSGRIVVGTSSWAGLGCVEGWYPPGLPARDRLGPRLAWYEAVGAVWVAVDAPPGEHWTIMPPVDAVTRPGLAYGRAHGGTCFNSQVFIERDGRLLGVHRKLQPTYVERIVWGQGGGATLRVFDSAVGRVGGLACWEHTMNLARQALIEQGQQIHAAAWPGLSTMSGFEAVADAQIDAMMKTHALTAQVFVIAAGNPVDQTCLDWMQAQLGDQDLVTLGGGWSAVVHPFNAYLAGPHTGLEERLVTADIDLGDLKPVKVWVDSRGHYARPEILRMSVDGRPLWHDETAAGVPAATSGASVAGVAAPAELPTPSPPPELAPGPAEETVTGSTG